MEGERLFCVRLENNTLAGPGERSVRIQILTIHRLGPGECLQQNLVFTQQPGKRE